MCVYLVFGGILAITITILQKIYNLKSKLYYLLCVLYMIAYSAVVGKRNQERKQNASVQSMSSKKHLNSSISSSTSTSAVAFASNVPRF